MLTSRGKVLSVFQGVLPDQQRERQQTPGLTVKQVMKRTHLPYHVVAPILRQLVAEGRMEEVVIEHGRGARFVPIKRDKHKGHPKQDALFEGF